MAFSFNSDLGSDIDNVRFNIGDVYDKGHYLENETISALLLATGSVGGASVACVEFIITQLSQPDFKNDHLQVSNAKAKEGFETILQRLRIKFGVYDQVPVASVEAVNFWRADSNQTDGNYSGE